MFCSAALPSLAIHALDLHFQAFAMQHLPRSTIYPSELHLIRALPTKPSVIVDSNRFATLLRNCCMHTICEPRTQWLNVFHAYEMGAEDQWLTIWQLLYPFAIRRQGDKIAHGNQKAVCRRRPQMRPPQIFIPKACKWCSNVGQKR